MADIYVTGSNVMGAEIFAQDFSDASWILGTGWTTADGSQLTGTAVTDNARVLVDLVDDDYYRFEWNISSYTSGTFKLLIGGGIPMTAINYGNSGETPRTYSYSAKAIAGTINGFNGDTAFTGVFDSASLKHYTTSGAGTEADPFIGAVNQDFSTLTPGDTLYLDGNIVNNTLILDGINGTAANPITIKGLSTLTWANSVGSTTGTLLEDNNGIIVNNCEYLVFEDIHYVGNDLDFNELGIPGMYSNGMEIQDDCHNIVIKNCSFTYCNGSGISIWNAPLGMTVPNTYITIDNVDVSECGSRGIALHANHSIMQNCTLVNIGNRGFADASASVVQGGGCIIRNNYFENSGSDLNASDSAISLDGYSLEASNHGMKTQIYRNTFKTMYGAAITIYNGSDADVFSNVFDGFNINNEVGVTTGLFSAIRHGRGSGSVGTVGDSARICNNIFMNDGGINVGSAAITLGYAGVSIPELKIRNNIFKDCVQFYKINDALALDNVSIDNNLYYNTDADYTGAWDPSAIAADGTDYDTFVDWQGSSLSPDANGLNIAPQLDASYYPHLDSPLVGAGSWFGKFLTDKGGRPFKRSKPSIGVWEVANRDPANRNIRE